MMKKENIRFCCDKLRTAAGEYRIETMGALMLLLLTVQRTVFGLKYFPAMDDWFLYFERKVLADPMAGADLSVRPLAGLLDIYVITPLADHMIAAELLLMLMLAAAVYFMCKAFSLSRISSGAILMVSAAMAPIGFEALYWIAAASRIIVSLFFISLCIFLEAKYMIGGKRACLAGFILSGAVSVWFYEMMIPIYFALTVIVMLKHRKRWWIMIFPVVFTAVSILYYKMGVEASTAASRAETVDKDLFSYHIQDMWDWYKKVFGELQGELLTSSFRDGAASLLKHPVSAALLVVISAAFAAVSRGSGNDGALWYDLLMGIGLIAAAVSVMVILSYVRLPFRVAYPACIGAALIVEAVFCRILPKTAYKCLVFALVLGFSVCNIGELNLYRWNSARDEEYCADIMAKTDALDSGKWVFIFNERDYWYDDRVAHLEYVKAVSENYASLTGMIRYKTGRADINNIMTVNHEDVIGLTDYTGENISLYYITMDGELRPCRAEENKGNYELYNDEGEFIGSLTRVGGGMVEYEEYKG